MEQQDKFRIKQQTSRAYLLLRFQKGISHLRKDRRKQALILGYSAVSLLYGIIRTVILRFQGNDIFTALHRLLFGLAFPVCLVGGLGYLIVWFGTPAGAKRINENLARIGFTNSAGETPLLIEQCRHPTYSNITVMEFESNGIPRTDWEDKQEKIEAALDVHIVKIQAGKNQHRILLHALPGRCRLPDVVFWNNNYLSKKEFELVLGESFMGKETINLAHVPHVLLGGSTGSGKSMLLKLLLMQCIGKGAKVIIADFKGGVDFSAVWHDACIFVMEEQELFETLAETVQELERRKDVLRLAGCANISGYNQNRNETLSRIVFACDEVAEVLDKTGANKEQKELVAAIENRLSILARQGRAFGIHLILATQRPDANILSGQIRNNINCRVCGRADNVLSQIILDSADAADKIPKDAQGTFLSNNRTVFQGYLFDERDAFGGWNHDKKENVHSE